MPQLSNGLAPEERAEILRVRPQGALCNNFQRGCSMSVEGSNAAILVQARHRSPPPTPRSRAQTKKSQEVARPPPWETLPAENRRRLSQLVARVISRHRLLLTKEVSND